MQSEVKTTSSQENFLVLFMVKNYQSFSFQKRIGGKKARSVATTVDDSGVL
jgi:hypothetical protein